MSAPTVVVTSIEETLVSATLTQINVELRAPGIQGAPSAAGAVMSVDGRTGDVTLADLYIEPAELDTHASAEAAARDAAVAAEAAARAAAIAQEASNRAAAILAHASDQTDIHGIADTADLILEGDPRLTDPRSPTGGAGGVLSGNYPSPGFAVDMAEQGELNTEVAARQAHEAQTTDAHGGIVAATDPRLSDARLPTAHKATHEPGGTDALAVDAAAGVGSLRSLGTGATQAAAGNDARLSDQRVPTDGSVNNAKVAAGAAIAESKLALDVATGLLIPKSLLTAKGQLIGASANGTPVAIPAPTADGQVLTGAAAQAGGVAWAAATGGGSGTGTPDSVRVFNSAALPVPHNTPTPLTFNTERFDSNGLHSTLTNTGRLTCQTAGKYLIQAQVSWPNNTSGQRSLWIDLNGTVRLAENVRSPSGGVHTTRMIVSTVVDLTVGDWVECEVFQDSGVTLNVESVAQVSPEFMMVRLADGGAGAGLTKITETIVGVGGQASVRLPATGNLPTTYRDLIVEYTARGTAAVSAVEVWCRLNDVATGSAYNWEKTSFTGTGSTVGNIENRSVDQFVTGVIPAATGTANRAGMARLEILDYARTVFHKIARGHSADFRSDSTNEQQFQEFAAVFKSTAAIFAITFLPTSGAFAEGSIFTLYGTPA